MKNNIIKLDQNQDDVVGKASEILKSGGVLILPFDTVYGLCAEAGNADAVARIFDLKNRDLNKPIGVAVDSIDGIENIAKLDEKSEQYISSRIPGKFTFILKARLYNRISKLCQKNGTIAVRVPNSDIILSIIKKTGMVLAQTSANIAGAENIASVDELINQFGSKIDLIDLIIDDGRYEKPVPSVIIDMTKDEPKRIERS